MKRHLFALLLVAGVLLGCEPETIFSIDVDPLSFSHEGGSVTLDLVANKPWSATSYADWCVVTPGSGDGKAAGTRLTVTCSKNALYDERVTSISISCEDQEKQIYVRQAFEEVVIMDAAEYEVGYEWLWLEIPLKTNMGDYEVTIVSGEDWIRIMSTKGLHSATLKMVLEENEGPAREGRIEISSLSSSFTFTIRQGSGIYLIPDENTFPDPVFRQYCIETFDKNNDGALSFKEAREATHIEIVTDNVSSLKGVEYFPKLYSLTCSGSGWSDDSRSSSKGRLSTLDVSKNASLRILDCSFNQLTELDLSDNHGLWGLMCIANQLTTLVLSVNETLEGFDCSWNQLSTLDVSGIKNLSTLDCDYNRLTSLDVSHNVALTNLGCSFNPLPVLDASKNLQLEYLNCYSMTMTDLYLSKRQNITEHSWWSGTTVHFLD